MSLKKKLLSGGAWAFGGKVVSTVGAFLLNMLLARALNPADYGAYFVCLNTILILGAVSAAGMDQIVVRLVAVSASAGNSVLVRRIVERCLGIVAIATLLTVAILALGAHWFFAEQMKMPQIVAATGIVSVWLFSSTLLRQIAETFRGLSDIRMATLYSGLRNNGVLLSVVTCAATACLVFAGALTLDRVFVIMALSSVLVMLAALATLFVEIRDARNNEGGPPGRPFVDFSAGTGYLLSESWPLWLSTLCLVLNNQGVGWLAGVFDSPQHVALYGLASRFVTLAITPMVIGNSVVPPIIAELYSRGELTKLQRVAQSVAALVSIPSAALFVLLLIAGHWLLGALFGAFYRDAYSIVLILCVGQIINVATGSWQVVLPMVGQKNQMLLLSVFSAFVQIVSGVVGGHYWGVYGVAGAFCLSMIVTNLAGMIVTYRKLGIWTFVWLDKKAVVELVSMVKARLLRKRAGNDQAPRSG